MSRICRRTEPRSDLASGPKIRSDPRFIDYYGRPWAQNWEQYFEVGWDKPDDDLPANVLEILDRLEGKK